MLLIKSFQNQWTPHRLWGPKLYNSQQSIPYLVITTTINECHEIIHCLNSNLFQCPSFEGKIIIFANSKNKIDITAEMRYTLHSPTSIIPLLIMYGIGQAYISQHWSSKFFWLYLVKQILLYLCINVCFSIELP